MMTVSNVWNGGRLLNYACVTVKFHAIFLGVNYFNQ
jgi:hypothetical protein